MRKLILASHGSLAEGMKSAAAMILGGSAVMDAFGLDTWGTPQAILEEVKKIMAQSPEDEYVLLCDIKGGSVCNALMELSMEPNVSVISGMNLNVILALALTDENVALADEVEGILEECRQGIQFFNASIMKKIKEKESSDEIW